MRTTLKRKLTGSMMLTVLAAMMIVSVCLLLGVMHYSSAQFSQDMAEVFTTDLLTEMNTAATGTTESAAEAVAQLVDANAGQLRIGFGREYSIWDAATGSCVGGTQADVNMTDNIVLAMGGMVGDTTSLLRTKMDIAIPVTGDVSLIVDIQDDGNRMRTLCWNILALLLAAAVLSLLLCLFLSNILARAFADAAALAAREVREKEEQAKQPSGDWEAMALALYQPEVNRDTKTDALDVVTPYLSDGYVKFDADGLVLEMNTVAETMLDAVLDVDAKDDDMLTFDKVFGGVPMPEETQSMVHGQFTKNGRRLDVVFVALDSGTFAAIVNPVAGGLAR